MHKKNSSSSTSSPPRRPLLLLLLLSCQKKLINISQMRRRLSMASLVSDRLLASCFLLQTALHGLCSPFRTLLTCRAFVSSISLNLIWVKRHFPFSADHRFFLQSRSLIKLCSTQALLFLLKPWHETSVKRHCMLCSSAVFCRCCLVFDVSER